jgi:hypothetical protein
MNPYRVLGVGRWCSPRTLDAAYRLWIGAADPMHDGQYVATVCAAYSRAKPAVYRRRYWTRRLLAFLRVLGVAAVVVTLAILLWLNWWAWTWEQERQERRGAQQDTRAKAQNVDMRRYSR